MTPRMSVGDTITVRKLDAQGRFVLAYSGTLAEVLPTGVRLDARWERSLLDLGYTTFEPDDRFTEWYFTDRWYSINEIHHTSGALKGWYCNVVAPASIETTASGHVVSYRDLLLDLWVAPDGAMLTLDEDEFAADTSLDAETRSAALAGLAALRQLVAQRAGPFESLRRS
ncbi:MAG: DUF402 domain-containing protein [Ktedonobacterales bacterium]